MNNKYCDILRKENNKIFEQYFSIINKEKFGLKYQNVVDKHGIKENVKIRINEKYDVPKVTEAKEIIKQSNILWYKRLIQEIDKINFKTRNRNKNRKAVFSFGKFKKELIYIKSKINNLSITFQEILTSYKLPKHSYHFPLTHDLIFAIKTKDLKTVNLILDNHKYLVLDRDYTNRTPLHWAVRGNFYQIIPKIMEYGAHTEKKDYIGDNPLLIAVKKKYMESVVFLFLYLSSPFVKDRDNKNILMCCRNNFRLKNMCDAIIDMHLKSVFMKTKELYESIQRQFLEYIINEFKGEIESDAYEMVCSKMEVYRRKNKVIQK